MGLILCGLSLTGKGIYMGSKAYTAQILLNEAWTKTVETGTPALPWPWMDTVPIAKLTIPSLGKSAIVLSGTSGQALAFGPAHMQETPSPGKAGLSIIAAHKNTHFSFLKDLRKGDRVKLTDAQGTSHIYHMRSAEIIHKDRFHVPSGQNAESPSQIALVTCYPFDAISYRGPMRYVVILDRVTAI